MNLLKISNDIAASVGDQMLTSFGVRRHITVRTRPGSRKNFAHGRQGRVGRVVAEGSANKKVQLEAYIFDLVKKNVAS